MQLFYRHRVYFIFKKAVKYSSQVKYSLISRFSVRNDLDIKVLSSPGFGLKSYSGSQITPADLANTNYSFTTFGPISSEEMEKGKPTPVKLTYLL